MIREFRAENRCEVVMPVCPYCKNYCVRDFVKARMGEGNSTRKYGNMTMLDPLTFGPTMTLTNMAFRCKKHPFRYILPTEELVILNKYPANNIKFVTREGREL